MDAASSPSTAAKRTIQVRWTAGSFSLLLCLAGLTIAADKQPEKGNWDQWRGPERNGSTDSVASPWPQGLKGQLAKTWNTSLQPSYSGPVLRGNLVYTTETIDKKSERVTAYDRNTGEKVWQQEWDGAIKVPFFARANGSWIRSTPAVDEELLYVGGIRDHLVALNRRTGSIVWSLDCVKDFKSTVPSFGCVCSPLVDKDNIYVQAAGSILKLNKRTGELVWQALADGGGMYGSAFSSPVIEQVNGEAQLLAQTRKSLVALDPDTGKVLWSRDVPAFRGMNILTPTVWNNQLFTSAYGGRSFLFDPSDANEVKVTWENKTQAYMSSPIVHGDHVYVQLRNRRFTCIDLKTGQTTWTTSPFKAQYWSMLSQGDRILALDDLGNLRLIRANPTTYDLIDEVNVSGEPTWAHIANDGEQLFVRDLNGLTAYRFGSAEDTEVAGR